MSKENTFKSFADLLELGGDDIFEPLGELDELENFDGLTTAPVENEVIVEKVQVYSREMLEDIKAGIVFRLPNTLGEKFNFSKVCNVSKFDKDALFVTLYLNGKGKDHNTETGSFEDCAENEFFGKAAILVSTDVLDKYTVDSRKYQKKGENFGKISLRLIPIK